MARLLPRSSTNTVQSTLIWLAACLVLCGCSKSTLDLAASEARTQAGLAAWKKGDLPAALAEFEAATAANPANRHAWFGYAATALKAGQGPTSRAAFSKYEEIVPRDPAGQAGLALAYLLEKDVGNALIHLNRSTQLDESDVAVKDLKERVETERPVDTRELAAIDRRVLLIDPKERAKELVRLQIRGLNFVRETIRWKDAEREYEAALRLDPDDPTCLLGYAATAMRGDLDSRERGLVAIERFLEIEPDSGAGQYCLAALLDFSAHSERVIEALERARQLAPDDQDIVYLLGNKLAQLENDSKPWKDLGSFECFERSLELNPFCSSTHKELQAAYRRKNDKEHQNFHEAEFQRLTANGTMKKRFPQRNASNPWCKSIDQRLEWIDRSSIAGESIAEPPRVTFEASEPSLPIAAEATIVDIDGDCDLDLVLPNGTLLLNTAPRNTGNATFESSQLPLPQGANFSQVLIADFENDGFADLCFVGGDRMALLSGDGAGGFVDRTRDAGLESIAATRAIAFDYDHEGDVDLLVVTTQSGKNSLRMLRNALPPRITKDALPQEIEAFANAELSFGDVTADAGFSAESIVALTFGDIENGNDTDVVAIGPQGAHLFTNRRGGKFDDIAGPGGLGRLSGTAVDLADLDADGWLDLVAIDGEGRLVHARNRGVGVFAEATLISLGDAKPTCFSFVDFDNDGALDLAVGTDLGTRLLRNVAGAFVDCSESTKFSVIAEPVSSLSCGDFDQDGDDDVLVFHSSRTPHLLRNDGGNANRRIRLELKGDLSNRMAIGAKIEIADGAFFAKREVRSLPLSIGVGPRTVLTSFFVLWTNGVRQPYRDVDLLDDAWMLLPDYDRSRPTKEVVPLCNGWLVSQIIRMEGSCPLLYACDGERFHYVTDALCSAVLGLDIGGGQRALPNPLDAVRIRGDQLRPVDGKLKLALTEELRELTYLDWCRLVAIDHPKDVEVYTDNRFTFPPFPPFLIQPIRDRRPIARAIDHRGADVTAKLEKIDRQYVDSFARAAAPMQGMAEMHSLEIDLGDVASAKTLRLVLQGWFNWTNSSVNNALVQDGSWMFTPPMLDVADGNGGWIPRGMAGIPAGDNKHVVLELTGMFPEGVAERRVRLTTNLQIYWDEAFVATDDDPSAYPVSMTELSPSLADLHFRGYSEQVYPDGKEPNDYAYHSVTTDGSTFGTYYGRFAGRLTRFGDVKSLVSTVDDQFVIIHHGDELSLEFDASTLPPLADGYQRTYVFRSFGWAKDMDHNTGASTTVEPLPFRGMSSYPPPAGESYPDTPEHRRYRSTWNTRASLHAPMTHAPLPPLPPEANGPQPQFTEVTRASGVSFQHAEGHDLVMLEDTMGAGAAWGDYDGDGDDDLFLVQGPGPGYEGVYADRFHHRLFRNEGDGAFRDVTEFAGVGGKGRGMAALFADLDDDGDQDLFVSQNGANLLYRNEGNGTFTDVALDAGVAGAGYHSGIAAGDYDKDGDLDLYIGRYVTIDPRARPAEAPGFERGFVRDDPPSVLPMTYPPAKNTLWRNDGELRFTDVTEHAGVADDLGRTLGVLFSDFDHDGWLDLFCANDVSLNNFFRNQGDGTFEALAFDVGLDDPRGAMGVALADVDDDTDLDLAVTYWQLEPNGLYRNNVIKKAQKRTRIPTFEEIAARTGFSDGSIGKVGWGVSVTDLDNDGHLDAAIVNGYTSPDYESTSLCVPQPPLLLMGTADSRFEDVTRAGYGAFFDGSYNGRGLAGSDYDADGDLDLLVTQNNGDAILLRNDGGNRGSWLQIELEGDATTSTRDAAGARVTVEAGGTSRTRVLLLGSSYLCGETKVLHFGLGDATTYSSITVTWPSGKVTTHGGGASRRRVTLEESETR